MSRQVVKIHQIHAILAALFTLYLFIKKIMVKVVLIRTLQYIRSEMDVQQCAVSF